MTHALTIAHSIAAPDETITGLEATLAALPSVTALLASGAGASSIAARLLENVGGARPGGGEGSNCVVPSYGPCEEADIRARMARACAALGATELRRIVSEEGKLEVTDDLCGWCVRCASVCPSFFPGPAFLSHVSCPFRNLLTRVRTCALQHAAAGRGGDHRRGRGAAAVR